MKGKDTGIVNIRGKEYLTVAKRIDQFRKDHPDWTIKTDVYSVDDQTVVMRAEIRNPEDRVIATGHAEEDRSSSQINRTSALENAETSAVGRALAFYLYAGSEIASADEVAAAIQRQDAPRPSKAAPRDNRKVFGAFCEEHQIDKKAAAMWLVEQFDRPPSEMSAHQWTDATKDANLSRLLDWWEQGREAGAA